MGHHQEEVTQVHSPSSHLMAQVTHTRDLQADLDQEPVQQGQEGLQQEQDITEGEGWGTKAIMGTTEPWRCLACFPLISQCQWYIP
jgi:hypothetical protein